MHLSILPLLALAFNALSIPVTEISTADSLLKRALTPDATCGGANKYTCQGSQYGNCCSSAGYCGSTEAYCGTGCQAAFGTCNGVTTAPSGLADCLNSKSVPIRLISSPDFPGLAEPFNLRLAYTPAVIVLPTTTNHISDAVLCASQNGIKVQAKSGGHSYASYSSGGQNGSMVIDLENFQEISLDANGIAKVGAGVRLGNLALGIYNTNNAKRALPHGTCPGVGLGGHATHGGFGYSSRHWGLTLDTITALDVTLANGSTIHTTSLQYPDIYYALRGAADSFGIVNTFYLATKPAPTSVVQYSFSISNIYSSVTAATNIFLHLQDFAQNATIVDQDLGFGIYLDAQQFVLQGTYFGSLETFNSKIRPELLRGLPTPSTSNVQSVDWITSLTILAGAQLAQPLTGYNAHDDFYAKSIKAPESAPLTAAAITSYFNYIVQNGVNAPFSWFSIINLYGGPDSQINVIPSTSSAYSDRANLWVFQNYASRAGSTSSAIISFVTGLNNAVTSAQPQTAFGAYANYVDPELTAAEAHSLYYDAPTYAKLNAIKNEVDPGKVFWNPQAVGN